jgi:tyrosyl-tRNA synthetase
MVNNHDWLGQLGYIELLQEVGTHFTVNRMLTFDSVKLRLEREQPMTFLEFNYMILQGYDFRHLSKANGRAPADGRQRPVGQYRQRDRAGRRMDGVEVFGLTTPLLTTADGAKMGKTAAGAVWLNEEQLPAYDFWQYWRNVDDRDVGKFLRLFTDLPLDEIARLEALEGSEINAAKIVLANEVTRWCAAPMPRSGPKRRRARPLPVRVRVRICRCLPPGPKACGWRALTGIGFTASNGEAKRKLAEGAVKLEGEW